MKLYKHINGNDIAFEITKKYYIKEKRIWKLKVSWWNIGRSHPPFSIGAQDKLQLTRKQLNEWVPYESTFYLKYWDEYADKRLLDEWRKQWLQRFANKR